MARRAQDFQTIRSEGGLLPSDLLRRVITPTEKLDGTGPQDYGLPAGERLNEVITQSWNRLRKHWAEFRTAAAALPESEAGTGLTNDKWNLPLLRELGFGPLPTSAGPEIGGRTYAIARFGGPAPVHLVGCGLSLDRRKAGTAGASAASPHGLVQEFLNRSPAHLWAIVSNGLTWRILRDNQALSRQSYLEFDLQAMLDGEVYSDFVLLWLMSHATRFEPRDSDRPETCWLEQWTRVAVEQGTRALGDLRMGVGEALQVLGQGFTSQPKNTALRESLRSGQLSAADLHGQLLRVVYRLIFLFVAEDRSIDGRTLLHPPDDSKDARVARARYTAHYSTARLREMAGKIKGSRHGDLWRQLQPVVGALSGEASFAAVRDQLALPALGSFLWSQGSTSDLNGAELSNHDLLEAVRNLAFTRQGRVLRPVDYKNLGAEELGGVYEGLLALTPQISGDGARFTFAELAGNERKTSGSYYTPDSLVQCLLDSALDPVVEEAIKGKTGAAAEEALLALKICDPAVGSGHFLVGAAHRMARHLARVRALAQGESEPSPLLYQHALRDVIGRCLYGVDINPMAAELCRVSLWLEALEPGMPLSFLDHHIRVGNSLLGTVPELIAAGLPDEAFSAIEGDDKRACTALRKRNKAERRNLGPLFELEDENAQTLLEHAAAALKQMPDARPEDIRAKELAFRRQETTPEYTQKKQLADAWCAAFVIRKHFLEAARDGSASGITQGHLNGMAAGRPLTADIAAQVKQLGAQYQFFHWHLAFPEVFAEGGFDCVLGNPPWELPELKEQEWFAIRRPDIAGAKTASLRKSMIDSLAELDPPLYRAFLQAKRMHEGVAHIMGDSGLYPLCGRGRMNLYAVFAEKMRQILVTHGRLGVIVPTGIATDDTTKAYFQDLVESQSLVSLFDFENRQPLFPAVDSRMKFCLLTVGSGRSALTPSATFVFFAHNINDLDDEKRRFTLSGEEVARINPNTRTCPTFRSQRDAVLAVTLYEAAPPLIRDVPPAANPWSITIRRIFNMGIRAVVEQCTEAGAEGGAFDAVPMYEAKMVHQYDHRFGTYVGQEATDATVNQKQSSDFVVAPRFVIGRLQVKDALRDLSSRQWLLAWRDISNSTNERTMIAAAIPRYATDFTLRVGFSAVAPAGFIACLLANLNSFALDYCARQVMGGTHMSDYIVKQLPLITPEGFATQRDWLGAGAMLHSWIIPRSLELSATSWDLQPFAEDMGWPGPPFKWDEERRFLLRAELDAAFFHLYLPSNADGAWCHANGATGGDAERLKSSFPTPRSAVDYVLDTFPIVRRKDEEKYDGDFRTKRVILEIYDAMQDAMRRGQPYQTRLDPPPADPRCCHPDR